MATSLPSIVMLLLFATALGDRLECHRHCTILADKWCSSFHAEDKAVPTSLEQVPEDVSLQKMRIASYGMSTLQRIQNRHPFQQVANSDENEILDFLVSHTDTGCHLTLSWCPIHSGIRGNELADVAAKEGTTVEHEGVSQHNNSAITAVRQATKEPRIIDKRLRRIFRDVGENVNHNLESIQLSRKDQVAICILRSGQYPNLKYCPTRSDERSILRKCGIWEETVEHVMWECP